MQNLCILEMAMGVGERRPEQIVAKEQSRTVQQLTYQRRAAAVKTRHDQLIAQGVSSLLLGL
jgi:hypothetical protein